MSPEPNQMSPAELAQYIDTNKRSVQVEQGDRHCSATCAELRRLGWRYRKTYSSCSKATYEDSLEKDGYRLNAVSASFLGTFSDYRVWPMVAEG